MKHFYIFFVLILTLPLNAKMLISPIDAMSQNFGLDSQITKENILLTNAQANKIEDIAKTKLEKKIVRVFKAQKNNKIVGYGVLINKKIRSKNGVVLYMISSDSILKTIEIIAFNEPMEYIPSNTWMSQFQNRQTKNMLILSKEIPTITGATMSARNIVDGSRIAFAIYNEILKDK